MKELITGIVQGITEFLPISSSGHLILCQELLNISEPGITLEVSLHLATLVAVLIFFFKDIKALFVRERFVEHPLFLLFVGSIPAGVIGLLFKNNIETYFENIRYLPYFFIINSIILLSTKLKKKDEIHKITPLHALIIGFAQALAILPGISRSGSTVSAGLLLGLEPQVAFSFSFLLSIPSILGAAILELPEATLTKIPSLIIPTLCALITGLFSLYLLKKILKIRKLYLFGFYTLALAVILLILIR
ncbi:MAG TPA: undecaprenyl-diphosphate phosphatase [Candidatus Hydrothermia bacterium]|nr:undecaprenyl-diphosphate phosphatase [Candidatus Hydrothermia bacterium]HOL23143.1 undecaprenyl-diphosphate phosphatase [Candidatus Hydrothermia bacterium]HOP32671.1 undecaprenyl-diphosphate phosphatase [Candidatus Hydrothermia bacterium]HPO78153.1 undecaprenyl-diphosphate phosphatase [Candidatus Hydrothermia bacterium]HRD23064.1 undecaprenyl-diphosphate phosphatase [Candidatus Hydrothermia bacterium]